ncbi:MAG: hypothetical protein JWQ09_2776 [Segetibacter sp.]|nr:hypothetical protein [Segetibacter sp.]
MRKITTLLTFILLTACLYAQVSFKTVYGKKANYSITIPSNYIVKEAIGANVDMKYVNSEGASIVTVVKTLPAEIKESDIEQMNLQTNQEFKDGLEATGLQNVTVIKRGLMDINGVRTSYAYYRDSELYYHSIMQFRKGKLINLTYTCENAKRETYMPYVFRVVNSLKS